MAVSDWFRKKSKPVGTGEADTPPMVPESPGDDARACEGSEHVFLRVDAETSTSSRQHGLPPPVFIAALLAVEDAKSNPGCLIRHADGTYRLEPGLRSRIRSLFIYGDSGGGVIVTDTGPEGHASYKFEGRVNIPAYGSKLCQILGVDRTKFLDVGPVLHVSPSAASRFRDQGFLPSMFAANLLAAEHAQGNPKALIKESDGSSRLHPSARANIASLFIYRDDRGQVIVVTAPPDEHPSSYRAEGKVDLMVYAVALCQALGADPTKCLDPTIRHVPGPSRFCRCPKCADVLSLEGLSESSRAVRIRNYEAPRDQRLETVLANCSRCKAALDVSDRQYDLPEVKLNCPQCKSFLYGPADELLGKPCPVCRNALPSE
jgi:hypothetical protein